MKRLDQITRYTNPEVLRFLASRGRRGAFTTEICEELQLDKTHAGRILHALESVDLIRSEGPGHPAYLRRQGIRWFIRRSVVAKTLEDLASYILEGKS